MGDDIERADDAGDLPGVLRSWVMIALTLIFILLYASALTGWLRPLADERMVARIEPIIFVIIGYYFGRLPAQMNEHTLKGEIARQTKKADAAQSAKEQALRAAEALEEKVRNARATLAPAAQAAAPRGASEARHERSAGPGSEEPSRGSVIATLNILNS